MKEYSLGPAETGMAVKIVRIIFGIVCIGTAVFWMIFTLKAAAGKASLWVTVLFLTGFGMYQIWSAFGKAGRFIRIDDTFILLKKNSFMPVRKYFPADIDKIEIFTMSISFGLKSGKKDTLRFGNEYADHIDPVKEELEAFAGRNNIRTEVVRDEI
jgi:hypothetical protein